jgi:hypothetical protein
MGSHLSVRSLSVDLDARLSGAPLSDAIIFHMVAVDISSSEVRAQMIALAKDTGADIFDPRCILEVNGTLLYRDTGHLAASKTGILMLDMIQVLRGQ